MPTDNLSSKYFEGTPCVKCGSTTRYINKKCCVACNHKQDQKWRQENPQKCHDIGQKWYRANLEKTRTRAKNWYRANPEKVRERVKNWQQTNPERVRESHQISTAKNRAIRLQAEGSYTTQEWITLRERYGNRCLCCGRHQSELKRVLEQDHIVPVTKGGSNWISNIQPLCRTCNDMGHKGTKTIDYRHSLL